MVSPFRTARTCLGTNNFEIVQKYLCGRKKRAKRRHDSENGLQQHIRRHSPSLPKQPKTSRTYYSITETKKCFQTASLPIQPREKRQKKNIATSARSPAEKGPTDLELDRDLDGDLDHDLKSGISDANIYYKL